MTQRPHPVADRPVSAPLLPLRLPEEISRLKGEADWTGGKRSITLSKQGGLRVVLMALRAGATTGEHSAAGAITVHVLEGRIGFVAAGQTKELMAGDIVALEAGLPHDVQAVDESVFLLTLGQAAAKA